MSTKTKKLPAKLVKYLEKAGIKHEVLEHKTVYTAIDAAATLNKKIEEIAKSLLVKADKDYWLVVLPADHNVDFDKLKKVISAVKKKDVKIVKIPGETVMKNLLSIKEGALTAFGKMHDLPVMVEKKMAKGKKAVFSSGTLNHSIEMATKDFIKMEEAVMASFGKKKKIKKQVVKKPKRKKVAKKAVKKTSKKKR